MKIIIPARRNSKGLPFKNRKLFNYTANIIPDVMKLFTYVATDDEEIKKMAIEHGLKVLHRTPDVSSDETSTKDLMLYTVDKLSILDETILVLYLTYPERTWYDVQKAMLIFESNNNGSLLCKKPLSISPFLMLKSESKNRGSQLFYHNLYRRQDYPECFEISHFIVMFNSSELSRLNNNIYNNDTYFMEISNNTIDVDEKKDLDSFEER